MADNLIKQIDGRLDESFDLMFENKFWHKILFYKSSQKVLYKADKSLRTGLESCLAKDFTKGLRNVGRRFEGLDRVCQQALRRSFNKSLTAMFSSILTHW